MAGNPITVEELQILITANYGDAIRGMLKMVDQVKQIAETKLAPVQKTIQQAMSASGNPTEQAVNATEKAAAKTVEAVKKTAVQAKKSIDDMIAEHDYLNEKIRLSQRQYDLMREKLAGIMSASDKSTISETDDAALKRISDGLEKARAEIESMTRESEKLAESISLVEPILRGTNSELNKAEKAIKKADKQMKEFGETAKKATKSGTTGIKGFAKTLKSTLKFMVIFQLVGMAVDAVTEGISNMAAESESANKTLSSYLSSFTFLKNSLGSAIMPILELLEPLVTMLVDLLAEGLNYLGMFIAALTGQTTYKKAVKTQQNFADSLNGTAEAAEKAKYALAGFDEVNILDFGDDAEALKEAAQAFEEVEIPQALQNLAKLLGISKNNNKPSGGDFDSTKVEEYAEAMEKANENVKELSTSLSGLKLPSWMQRKIPAPEFEPVVAPAVQLQPAYYPSLEKYGEKVPAPIFEPAAAPEINTNDYETSKAGYLNPIIAPVFAPVAAPEIDMVRFLTSLDKMISQAQIAVVKSKDIVYQYGVDIGVSLSNSLEKSTATVYNWGEKVGAILNNASQKSHQLVFDWGEKVGIVIRNASEKSRQLVFDWGEKIGDTVKGSLEKIDSVVYDWGVSIGKSAREAVEEGLGTASNVAGVYSKWDVEDTQKVYNVVNSASGVGNKLKEVLTSVIPDLAKVLFSSASFSGLPIPLFAGGGVITSPTLGIMGEYAGASNNPEIVTPQNIMYDTVVEANAPLVSAMYDMVREIITAINEKDMTVEVDGDVVGSTAVRYIEMTKRRIGMTLI